MMESGGNGTGEDRPAKQDRGRTTFPRRYRSTHCTWSMTARPLTRLHPRRTSCSTTPSLRAMRTYRPRKTASAARKWRITASCLWFVPGGSGIVGSSSDGDGGCGADCGSDDGGGEGSEGGGPARAGGGDGVGGGGSGVSRMYDRPRMRTCGSKYWTGGPPPAAAATMASRSPASSAAPRALRASAAARDSYAGGERPAGRATSSSRPHVLGAPLGDGGQAGGGGCLPAVRRAPPARRPRAPAPLYVAASSASSPSGGCRSGAPRERVRPTRGGGKGMVPSRRPEPTVLAKSSEREGTRVRMLKPARFSAVRGSTSSCSRRCSVGSEAGAES